MDEDKSYCPICNEEMKDEDWVTDDPDSPCASCQQIRADLIYDQMKEG